MNSHKFPLYMSLLNNLSKKELTLKQKKEFIDKIKIIDNNGVELLYALIITYYIDNYHVNNTNLVSIVNTTDVNNFLPYESVYTNNNIEFDFEKFPCQLKNILYKFIDIHLKSTEEDKKREND